MTDKLRLLLVGCGKMGGALLRQTLAARLTSEVVVVEPAAPPDFLPQDGSVRWVASRDLIEKDFTPDIVLFAVKPQQFADVIPTYSGLSSAVFLSIAAGITIAKLQTLLGNDRAAVVRAMPNLPASIGAGMTVAVANRNVTSAQRGLCEDMLKAVGGMAWLEDEALIDSVTALSGSGPAYVFALCEVMAKVGESMGLESTLAARLARQTVVGSGALLAEAPESAEALRRAVTSPGGTTEAALKILLGQGGLTEILQAAMMAASKRAKELAR